MGHAGGGRRRPPQLGPELAQSAAALKLTGRIAENHIGRILTKPGFRPQAQIAAWDVDPAVAGPARPGASLQRRL